MLEESETFQKAESGGVYPDNLQTVAVFLDMLTQWRVGPTGAIGLDYNVLKGDGGIYDIRGIEKADRVEVFEGLKVMERAALKEMRRK